MLLADTSGSMNKRMNLLKRSLHDLLARNRECEIALGCWNTDTEWFSEAWIHNERFAAAQIWISSLRSNGGTVMQQAIEQAMQKFPDASDVHVMGDGDVTPFSENSWASFRQQYPRTSFHFIVLNQSSPLSKQMAKIGGGTYREIS